MVVESSISALLSFTLGLLQSFETLSLDVSRNGLASLTKAHLILQASGYSRMHTLHQLAGGQVSQDGCLLSPYSEFDVGRDRLVKVADKSGLEELASELGLL